MPPYLITVLITLHEILNDPKLLNGSELPQVIYFSFFSEIKHGIKAEKLNRKMKWVKNAAQIPNIKQ